MMGLNFLENGDLPVNVSKAWPMDPAKPSPTGRGMMPPSQRIVCDDGLDEETIRVQNPPFDLSRLVHSPVVLIGLRRNRQGYVSARGIADPSTHRPAGTVIHRPAPPVPAPVRNNGGWPQGAPSAPPSPPRPEPVGDAFGLLVRDYAVCLRLAKLLAGEIGECQGTVDVTAIAATLYIQARKDRTRAFITRGEARAAVAALEGKQSEAPPSPPPPEPVVVADPLPVEDLPF